MPISSSNPSCHPTFIQGSKIIIVRPESRYFGQRGEVYGSSRSRTGTDAAAVIWVRLEGTGNCQKFLPSRLAIAPRPESEYRTAGRNTANRQLVTHHVPASNGRRHPNIEQIVETFYNQPAS